MILGVTGSRDGGSPIQLKIVTLLLRGIRNGWPRTTELHHGDAAGVDAEVFEIAHNFGIFTVGHPPLNPKFRAYCKSDVILVPKPYLDRDRDVVNVTDQLIALPSGREYDQLRSGTWYTVRYSVKVGHPVLIIYADGREEAR